MHKSENQFLEPPNPDTRVYSEGLCIFRKKKNCKNEVPPLPYNFLKIQWEINFLHFLSTNRIAPKKILNCNYTALY